MPIKSLTPTTFKPPRDVVITWSTFRKGLNTMLRENEVAASEMTQATNLVLIGSGAPTKRWGSQNYFLSAPTGNGRFLMPIKDTDSSQQVLAMTDWGILVKKSGASYTPITGASWASGYNLSATQLGGNVYIASESNEFVKYDFSTLTSFPTISSPAGLAATNLSGASGETEWSWKVTAASSSGGETAESTQVLLASMPQSLADTSVRVTWTPVSAASGVLVGYNVYRGPSGDERWIGGTENGVTTFDDTGGFLSSIVSPPTVNNTGGIKAKYIIRYKDRLILAGVPNNPTKVYVSGKVPKQERFDALGGGGVVDLEPESGEQITGLATYFRANDSSQTILVFKENSVWELKLGSLVFGEYVLLDPSYRLLTASQGCSSHRSIRAVENDIMFSNRKGIYILRHEPQLLNVINTNEISAKIRPFFEGLTSADLTSATAAYVDKKYVLSFPNSKQTIIFDRERLSFTGPWTTPFGINQWASYVDASGIERWIAIDSSDNYVTEFNKKFTDDKGTAINTVFKSRREDFGDWTIFKTINEVFMNFKSVNGSIEVNLYTEDRNGVTSIAKTFTISSSGTSGTSGMGYDPMGIAELGNSSGDTSVFAGELPKKSFVYKSSRMIQIEIRTTGSTANYELLGCKLIGIPQSRGNSPSGWQTS